MISAYTYRLMADGASCAPTWALWLTWQLGEFHTWDVKEI